MFDVDGRRAKTDSVTRYCFGAPYVCNELAGSTVTAGAFAHPAFLKEHHFTSLKSKFCYCSSGTSMGVDRIDCIEPLFLSCSEIDHTFDTASRRKAIDLLQADKKTYHLQLFSGVEHGFALRGNMKEPYERKSAQLKAATWSIKS